MSKLGKLESVEIRKVWKIETDFSDWLAEEDKLTELSKVIGIDLIDAKREEDVGALTWLAHPDKKASRIRLDYTIDWKKQENRAIAYQWMTEKAVAFRKVFNQFAQ